MKPRRCRSGPRRRYKRPRAGAGRLGWSIPSRRTEQALASAKGVTSNVTTADRFAANVVPVIRDIERAGVTTLQGIADALNARGIRTARGRRWYATTVRNVLDRADVEAVKEAA